jgi:hypothetical protein
MIHYPKYKIIPLQDGGAYVLITHKDGLQETWVGFAARDDAEAWIAEKKAKLPQSKTAVPAPG